VGHLREGPRIRQRIESISLGVTVNDIADELHVDDLSGSAALNGAEVEVGDLSDLENNLLDRVTARAEITSSAESGVCNQEALTI
jgi:hypothetical protein